MKYLSKPGGKTQIEFLKMKITIYEIQNTPNMIIID